MRILVADDHEVMRKGACAILTTGFNFAICDEASDGQEAIAKVIDHKPDIIILDVNMRGLGGFDAAKEIHRVRPDVPILFFTMHGDQFLSEAKRAGAQGFVSKEQGANVLVSAVKALLRGETFFPHVAGT